MALSYAGDLMMNGLVDPILSHRFLFWGVGAGAAFTGSLIGAVIRAATGGSAMEMPVASLIISGCGLTAACCMWMAFHPPSALIGRRKGDAVSSAAD